jgi:hypothetical protein
MLYQGDEVQLHAFFVLPLNKVEGVLQTSEALVSEEEQYSHWIGVCIGNRPDLTTWHRENILPLFRI